MNQIHPSLEELNCSVFDLNLSNRSKHALWIGKVRTLEQLLNMPDSQLARINSMMRDQQLQEILEFKQQYSVQMKSDANNHMNQERNLEQVMIPTQVLHTHDAVIKTENTQAVDNSAYPIAQISPLQIENSRHENKNAILLDSIEHNLGKRTYNCLKRARITNIEALFSMTDEELLKIRGMGQLALNEIHDLKAKLQAPIQDNSNANKDAEAIGCLVDISELDTTIITRIPLDIVDHGLSIRVLNCLRRAGIATVADLLVLSDETIHNLRGLGGNSLTEIRTFTGKVESHFNQITDTGLWSRLSEDTSIFRLDLSLTTLSKLYRHGIYKLDEFMKLTDEWVDEKFDPGDKAIIEVAMLQKNIRQEGNLKPIEINRPVSLETTPGPVDPLIPVSVTQFLIQLGCSLQFIPVMRLALEGNEKFFVSQYGFNSVFDLCSADKKVFDAFPNLIDRVQFYTEWLGKQTNWQNEIEAKLPNPVAIYEIRSSGREKLTRIILNGLGERDRVILAMRLGWQDGQFKTLQQLADKQDITRERVRQILLRVKQRIIANIGASDILLSFVALCKTIIDEQRIISLQQLIVLVNDALEFNDDENDLAGLIGYIVEELLEDQKAIGHYLPNQVIVSLDLSQTLVIDTVNRITDLLKKRKSPMLFTDIHNTIAPTLHEVINDAKTEHFLYACLQYYPDFKSFEGKYWGLKRWDKKLFDDIVMVLRNLNRPAHFTEITQLVNTRLSGNVTSAHTVHATLGRETNLFIRTDSGTFTLREWHPDAPIQPPKYIDLIEQVLEEAGQPLTIDEIFERVNSIRHAKKSSITMYLGMNNRFTQTGNKYGLVKWNTTSSSPHEVTTSNISANSKSDWLQRIKHKAFDQLNDLDQRKDNP